VGVEPINTRENTAPDAGANKTILYVANVD
jgi:hypothetical protein